MYASYYFNQSFPLLFSLCAQFRRVDAYPAREFWLQQSVRNTAEKRSAGTRQLDYEKVVFLFMFQKSLSSSFVYYELFSETVFGVVEGNAQTSKTHLHDSSKPKSGPVPESLCRARNFIVIDILKADCITK